MTMMAMRYFGVAARSVDVSAADLMARSATVDQKEKARLMIFAAQGRNCQETCRDDIKTAQSS